MKSFSICGGESYQDTIRHNDIIRKPIYHEIQLLDYTKKRLITNCENNYFNILKSIIKNTEYIIYPQVNLASIINKVNENSFHNELFRNVDFCIFNKDYCPIVIIEINDMTHKTVKIRQYRDIKVKEICAKACIPIITLWTEYAPDYEYIKKRLSIHLKL